MSGFYNSRKPLDACVLCRAWPVGALMPTVGPTSGLPPVIPKSSQLLVVIVLYSSRVVATCSMSLCWKGIVG